MVSRQPCFSARLKLDELFVQWLLLPESQKLTYGLIEDAKANKPLHGPTPSTSQMQAVMPPDRVGSPHGNHPPMSPGKLGHSLSRLSIRKSQDDEALAQVIRSSNSESQVPQFYFPNGRPLSEPERRDLLSRMQSAFAVNPEGLAIQGFIDLVAQVLELPSTLARVLFDRLAPPPPSTSGAPTSTGAAQMPPPRVTQAKLLEWIERHRATTIGRADRAFHVLRRDGVQYVTSEDLQPMLRHILASHPGLEFLKDTPEFQERYLETVTYRIMYTVNRNGSGRVTLKELRRADLLDALCQLDEEDDINKVLRYFSYEHFYVIYCKFWELDQDHDFMIDHQDLLRYGNCALTFRIVDRIFSQVPRRFKCRVPGKMGYEDFVWFILSEEDKSSEISLEYWFRCCDLDADGVIGPTEMLYFYEEQLQRMESLCHEPVQFEDVVCQMCDMLRPDVVGRITLRDLKRQAKVSGLFFNILFNINKFVAYEQRDPFLARQQENELGHLSQWDRFAQAEYVRLASEEEEGAMGGGGGDEDGMYGHNM